MRRKDAVTLIETLISIVLLQVCLCAILVTFVIGKLSVVSAKHRIEALNRLRQKVEELKNTAYANISNSIEPVTIDAGPDLMEGTSDDLLGTIETTITDMYGYKMVYGKLSWKDTGWGKGRDVYEDLTTYINAWSIYCG